MIATAERPKHQYRVVMRPMQIGDASALLELRNSPSVRENCLQDNREIDVVEHANWLADHLAGVVGCGWVIIGEKAGREPRLLGSVSYRTCGIETPLSERAAGIGVSVDPAVRRTNLATRMVSQTIVDAMEELDVIAVGAIVRTCNTPSLKLFAGLGWENMGVGVYEGAEVQVFQYPVGVRP